MPSVSFPPRLSPRAARLAGQISLLSLVVGLGACSGFDGLRSPVYTGSTANQRAIIDGQATAYQSPLGNAYVGDAPSVVTADLPPPGGTPAPAYGAQPTYGAAQPAYRPQTAYASPTATPSASPAPYTPPSYAAAGMPKPVGRVAPRGDQPRVLGAPPTTLGAEAARIDGRRQGGMAGGGMASGRHVHTVQSGDTAWNISHRYGITVDQLAAANGGSTTVKLGQQIVIPGAGGGAEPQPYQVASLDPKATPAPRPTAPRPIPAAVAEEAVAQQPVAAAPMPEPEPEQVAFAPQTGAAGAVAPAAPAPQPQADTGSGFRWPVRGRVISGFGKKPNGERNDGINLAVPEGTAVKAAEDGTVIYAGNELKSYGNLVLIRHSNGWVSAYAHNKELKVKRGESVRRGQIIALSGMSGGVTTPQVHFELRKDASPVDPLKHLTES